MQKSYSENITQLLKRWSEGEEQALSELMAVVYDELKLIANSYLSKQKLDHTLQPTALVHESYLHLVNKNIDWQNRVHFFAMSAKIMRNILIDYARKDNSLKHGGKIHKVIFDENIDKALEKDISLLNLEDALNNLEEIEPIQARVVELRFFGGLSIDETASVLGISPRSVDRFWLAAKTWLYGELKK